MPWIADRFLAAGAEWIDLATGGSVKLRVIAAGTSREQLEWSARCEILANLRHPLINPLVDYGLADREHAFEAYMVRGPVHADCAAAKVLLAHAVRFVRSYGVDLPPDLAELVLRPVAAGSLRGLKPIGVFLQRRPVFESVADALELAGPGGTTAIAIEGPHASGLRTLRLAAARAARLHGYVPLATDTVGRFPWIVNHLLERHVCVISGGGLDAASVPARALASLLCRLATASARRHLILSFARPGSCAGPVVHVDSMGVTAMAAMVFVDRELGPSADEVLVAARRAAGRPGLCLAQLAGKPYAFTRARSMYAHESPQPTAVMEGAELRAAQGAALGETLELVPGVRSLSMTTGIGKPVKFFSAFAPLCSLIAETVLNRASRSAPHAR